MGGVPGRPAQNAKDGSLGGDSCDWYAPKCLALNETNRLLFVNISRLPGLPRPERRQDVVNRDADGLRMDIGR